MKLSVELNDRERAIVRDALVAERLRVCHKRSGTKINFIRDKFEEDILIMNVVIAKLQRCNPNAKTYLHITDDGLKLDVVSKPNQTKEK